MPEQGLGEPFAASRAGCGGYRSHPMLAPTHCDNAAIWAGVVYYPYPVPGVVWHAFACDTHRYLLSAPRLLLDRDVAELQRRADAVRAATVHRKPWIPPQPLATGREARMLRDRAVALWEQNQPVERTPPPPRRRDRRAAERAARRAMGPGEPL